MNHERYPNRLCYKHKKSYFISKHKRLFLNASNCSQILDKQCGDSLHICCDSEEPQKVYINIIFRNIRVKINETFTQLPKLSLSNVSNISYFKCCFAGR